MCLFARWIEDALPSFARYVTVQRLPDADACEHRGAAERRDQDQGLHRRLPFRSQVLCFGQLRDVGARVFESDKLTTLPRALSARWQRDRFIKTTGPTAFSAACRRHHL